MSTILGLASGPLLVARNHKTPAHAVVITVRTTIQPTKRPISLLKVLGLRFGIADTMSVYDDDAGATAKGKQGVAAIFMLTIIFAIAVSFLWVTMSARLGYYIIQTFIGVGVSALVLVGLIEGAATNQRKMPRRPLLSPTESLDPRASEHAALSARDRGRPSRHTARARASDRPHRDGPPPPLEHARARA